ncbi:AAA family ATPase (plasmid) [Vibrio alginolyticus]
MNQKGGVGKSTFVAGLMSQLIHQGHQVELIDFDKQKSSHDWAREVSRAILRLTPLRCEVCRTWRRRYG